MRDARLPLAWVLGALLAAAPLAFGSTPRPALLAISAAAALVAIGALAAGARPASGSWGPFAILSGVACLQLVPLPPVLLEVLSPQAARLRESGAPEATLPWAPLSLDPHATLTGLILLGAAACVFGSTRFVLTRASAARVLAATMVAGGLFQAAFGVAEHLRGSRTLFGWSRTHYLDSAAGTFVNRNHFAGYLELTLLFSLGVLVSLAAGAGGGSERPLWRRALLAVSTPAGGACVALAAACGVMVSGLILSRSRAGALSGAIGLGVLLALCGRAAPRRAAGAAALVGLAVMAGGVYALGAPAAPLSLRYADTVEDLLGEGGRVPLWRDAARVAAAFPLTGAGLGSFERVYPSQRSVRDAQRYRHAHNDYLELAAETGLIGLAAGIWMMAGFGLSCWRGVAAPGATGRLSSRGTAAGAAAGVAALACHSLFDFNLHVPSNLLTLAAVAAYASAGLSGSGEAIGPHPVAA